MKAKNLLLLASCLIPTVGYAGYYEVTTCSSSSVTVFTGDNCNSSQTICYTHPGYMSGAKVVGCKQSDCRSGCTWKQFVFTSVNPTQLGGCTCPSTSIPECYETQSSSTQPYKCKAGCYGVAVYTGNSVKGCTKCPANASCSGGNYTNFKCNNGYYSVNNQCAPCPANASCSNNNFICNTHYYKNGNSCEPCPLSPDKSPASSNKQVLGTTGGNATSITECYLMASYPFTDSTGQYEFTQDCYYKQ